MRPINLHSLGLREGTPAPPSLFIEGAPCRTFQNTAKVVHRWLLHQNLGSFWQKAAFISPFIASPRFVAAWCAHNVHNDPAQPSVAVPECQAEQGRPWPSG